MLCSRPSFRRKQAPGPSLPDRPFDFAPLRANVRPFVLSVARKGGVEAWMPDHVRHDANGTQGYNLS